MQRILLIVWATGIATLAGGCASLKGADGKPVSLSKYDSVIVEDVEVSASLGQKQAAELLKGYVEMELLTGEKFKQGNDFDFDEFAKFVETYSTTPGEIDGKPLKPVMTREEVKKKYAKGKGELEPMMNKPKGTNPVHLKVVITEFVFPDTINQVVMGARAEAKCSISVYAPNAPKPLGTTMIEVTQGLPDIPLLPAAMATRAAKRIVFGGYTRKHIMDLMEHMSKHIVRELENAKKR